MGKYIFIHSSGRWRYMLFHIKSVKSLIITRFYSVVAMDVLSKEVLASYDSVLYDISYSYGYAHLMLLVGAIMYNLLYYHSYKRIENLVDEPEYTKQYIRGILLILFLVLTRNIQNAI
jgi:hypothetical protein